MSRLADVSINAVTKLLGDVGQACETYEHEKRRNLPCKRIQVDEIWSFVYSKQENAPEGMEDRAGDAWTWTWTWTAICADTKLVPSWHVGSRDAECAMTFMDDLARRLENRVQLTLTVTRLTWTRLTERLATISTLVKIYGKMKIEGPARYSPAVCTSAKKTLGITIGR